VYNTVQIPTDNVGKTFLAFKASNKVQIGKDFLAFYILEST